MSNVHIVNDVLMPVTGLLDAPGRYRVLLRFEPQPDQPDEMILAILAVTEDEHNPISAFSKDDDVRDAFDRVRRGPLFGDGYYNGRRLQKPPALIRIDQLA